jgi:hypothetical protein
LKIFSQESKLGSRDQSLRRSSRSSHRQKD